MILTAFQHMNWAKLLRKKAQDAPLSKKEELLKRAGMHVALARLQARRPELAPRKKPKPESSTSSPAPSESPTPNSPSDGQESG